jgi:hypothetical protein
VSDLIYRRGQFGVAATRNEDVGAFIHEPFCGSQSNAAIAASDQRNFSVKFTYRALLATFRRKSPDLSCLFS